MSSHAKASSAGSNTPRVRRLAVGFSALTAAFCAIALSAATAGAVPFHPFLETFGSANQPSFPNAEGLAVDQSSGDVLVIDRNAGTVSRWNPDGTPANFSALGTNVIDGFETSQRA